MLFLIYFWYIILLYILSEVVLFLHQRCPDLFLIIFGRWLNNSTVKFATIRMIFSDDFHLVFFQKSLLSSKHLMLVKKFIVSILVILEFLNTHLSSCLHHFLHLLQLLSVLFFFSLLIFLFHIFMDMLSFCDKFQIIFVNLLWTLVFNAHQLFPMFYSF